MCSACQPREVRAGSCCGAANLFNCCFGNVIALGRSPQQEGLIHSCEWAELWAPGHHRADPPPGTVAWQGHALWGRATGHTGASGTLGTGRSPRLVHVRPLPWMGGAWRVPGLGSRPADTYLVWETLWPVPWLHLVPACAHSHTDSCPCRPRLPVWPVHTLRLPAWGPGCRSWVARGFPRGSRWDPPKPEFGVAPPYKWAAHRKLLTWVDLQGRWAGPCRDAAELLYGAPHLGLYSLGCLDMVPVLSVLLRCSPLLCSGLWTPGTGKYIPTRSDQVGLEDTTGVWGLHTGSGPLIAFRDWGTHPLFRDQGTPPSLHLGVRLTPVLRDNGLTPTPRDWGTTPLNLGIRRLTPEPGD